MNMWCNERVGIDGPDYVSMYDI